MSVRSNRQPATGRGSHNNTDSYEADEFDVLAVYGGPEEPFEYGGPEQPVVYGSGDEFDVLAFYGGPEVPPLYAVPDSAGKAPRRSLWQRVKDAFSASPEVQEWQPQLVPRAAPAAPKTKPQAAPAPRKTLPRHLVLVSDDPFCSDEVAAREADNRRAKARMKISLGNRLVHEGLRLLQSDPEPGDFEAQWRRAQKNERELKKVARRGQRGKAR